MNHEEEDVDADYDDNEEAVAAAAGTVQLCRSIRHCVPVSLNNCEQVIVAFPVPF